MTQQEKPFLALLDAFPGAGKTHMFREIIFGALSLDALDDERFVYVYVAPTKDLCEEVYQAVLRQLKDYLSTQPNSLVEPLLGNLHRVWRGAEPSITSSSKRLDELLGTAPASLVKPLKPNNVIFTTHEAFVRVKNVPTAYPTWVFFDEARQCLGRKEVIRIPMTLAAEVLKPFNPVEVKPKAFQLEATELEKSSRKAYKLTFPKSGTVDIVVPPDAPSSAFIAVGKLKDVMENTRSGRSSIYILAPELTELSARKKSPVAKSISIFTFQSPEGMFQNYHRVTIMSAFFRDSQMFHSLRHHYRIVDLLRPPVDVKLPRWIRETISLTKNGKNNPRSRDKLLQMHTGSRLKIVPLLTSEYDIDESEGIETAGNKNAVSIPLSAVSGRDRLSKSTLVSGLLVTPEAQTTLIRYVEENNLPLTSRTVIESVWLHWYGKRSSNAIRSSIELYWNKTYGADYRDHVPALYSILKPFLIDAKTKAPMFPAWALTRQARSLFNGISTKFGTQDKPLLVYNASRSKLPYAPVARAVLIKVGLPTDSTPIEDAQQFLRDRFENWFSIPKTPRLNGLNTWDRSDHFVHLAALNPDPDTILLLKHILPKYDAEYDFMLENLVQTLYRTSLRNPSLPEDSPVFLYITKSAIGRLLSQKLKLRLEIFNFQEHSIRRKELVELDFVSESANQRRYARISDSKRKYSPETAVEVRRVQTLMRRYVILEKKGIALTDKQAVKLASLQKELRALQRPGM